MKQALFVVLINLFSILAIGQNVLDISSPYEEHKSLANYIYVFQPVKPSAQVEDIHQAAHSSFKALSQIIQFDPQRAYWAKMSLKSLLDFDKNYFVHWFSVSPMRLNYLDAYIYENGKLIGHKEFGFARPQSELKGTNKWDRFELLLKSKHEYTIYFKLLNSYGFPGTFDIQVLEPHVLIAEKSRNNYIFIFYEGMLWILILYNLLVFFFRRDNAYLYYSLYMASSAFYTLYFQKFVLSTVLTEIPQFNAYFWLLSLGIGPVFYWQFFRHSLVIKTILPPYWDKALKTAIYVKLAVVSAELISYTLFQNVKLLTDIVSLCIVAEVVFNVVVLIRLVRTRIKTGYFFFVGSMGLWVGFFTANILYMMGNYDAQIWGVMGVIFEALVFSLGLGYRMKISEKEKRNAQEALIEQLRKNDELQARTNQDLEFKVRERTAEIMQQQEEIQTQNDKLTETLSELNLTYKQIRDSITYARRIQNAVLPQREDFGGALSEYFVYYKPRDIVSGDFYWVKQIRNKLLIAAVDCTGHGVPGAFLSLLGIAFLNEISSNLVSSQDTFMANGILEKLRTKVKESLKQHARGRDNTAAKEAMDVALCIIDIDQMHMQFAGAHNPLYMIRDGVLNEYKGDRMPISSHKKERPFTNFEIDLQKGDTFYIFSDGILDQFGGQYGDKLKPKRFKQLLSSFKNIPLSKQQLLLDQALNDWKGTYRQLDDILVLGFKV